MAASDPLASSSATGGSQQREFQSVRYEPRERAAYGHSRRIPSPVIFPPTRFQRARHSTKDIALRYVMPGLVVLIASTAAFLHILPLVAGADLSVIFNVLFLALIPVGAIIVLIRWIDNWEPEPSFMYAVAFMWGAGIAALAALGGNNALFSFLSARMLSADVSDLFLAIVGAPLIEEAVKGAGVIIIALLFRSYFNGVIDGLVYGMLIGLGFAFTENIFYFVRYFDDIATVFQGRALENPFVHPVATGVLGLVVGYVSEKKNPRTASPLVLLGYVGACVVHSVHNLSVSLAISPSGRFILSFPLYIVVAVLVFYMRARGRNDVASGLRPYVEAGWLTSSEFRMLLNPAERRDALSWAGENAKALGGNSADGRKAMRRFQQEALRLGFQRSSWLRKGNVNTQENRQEEAYQLRAISQLREIFLGVPVYTDSEAGSHRE